MEELHIGELDNGMKIVHLEKAGPVSHCGVFINAGTRDESSQESGLAHFIEHALFKGTQKRKAFHILNRMDSVGGEIDAYTTKELTCIYSTFFSGQQERAIELLYDVCFYSKFPEKELEKEKDVIHDEINLYQDSPTELIYDEFEALLFKGHELGNPILGTHESVNGLNRANILDFTQRLYTTNNMVFSYCGNIKYPRLLKLLNKYFGNISTQKSSIKRRLFKPKQPEILEIKKPIYQSHAMLGTVSVGLKDENRMGMILLNNILGGPGLNSILNLKIREKYGFTYSIDSHYVAYSDVGLFSIYLGTDPKFIDKCLTLVEKELKALKTNPLTARKLSLAKQQLKGQIAIARENNVSRMLSYGKSLLQRGNIVDLNSIHLQIDCISSNDILELANKQFDFENFHQLIYQGKS